MKATAVAPVAKAEVTGKVRTGNVTRLFPAGTVTLSGGRMTERSELNMTTTPSGGAGQGKTTVPVTSCPPRTRSGSNDRPTGSSRSDTVCTTPPAAAEIDTGTTS